MTFSISSTISANIHEFCFCSLMGLTKAVLFVFVIIIYFDYSRALILLPHFKAHLLLGLSLPFSAIPPQPRGVLKRAG